MPFPQDVYVNPPLDNGHKAATDELLDAEVGLSRAKEEYRKLQQEVRVRVYQIGAF